MSRPAACAVAVGGGLVALGTVAPWATSEGPFSQSGLARGDGVVTGLIGLGLVLLGLMLLLRKAGPPVRAAAILLAMAGLAVGIGENMKVSDAIAPVTPSVHIGIGIYLVIVGSALALVGAWRRRRPEDMPRGLIAG
jgi:hypothetical protein